MDVIPARRRWVLSPGRGLITCALLAVLTIVLFSGVVDGARSSRYSGSRYSYYRTSTSYRSPRTYYSRYSYRSSSYRSYRSYRTYRSYRSRTYYYRYTPSRYSYYRSYSRYTYGRSRSYTYRAPSTTTTLSPFTSRYTTTLKPYRSSYTYRGSYYSYRSGSLATRYNTRYNSYYQVGYSRYYNSYKARTATQLRYSRAYGRYRGYYYYYYNMYFNFNNQDAVYLSRNSHNVEVCTNYEANNNGSALKLFRCPLPFEPTDFTYCCGHSNAQYCCRFIDVPGNLIGIIVGSVMAVIIVATVLLCCYKCKAKPKKYQPQPPSLQGRVIVSRTYVSGAAPVPPPNFAPPAQPPPPQTYPPPDGAYPPPSGTYPPPGGAFPSTSQPFASAAADSTSAPNNNFASPFAYNAYNAPPGGESFPMRPMSNTEPSLPPPSYNSIYS